MARPKNTISNIPVSNKQQDSGPKLKVDIEKMKQSKYNDGVEHESYSEPFKPAYTMTSERSAGYL